MPNSYAVLCLCLILMHLNISIWYIDKLTSQESVAQNLLFWSLATHNGQSFWLTYFYACTKAEIRYPQNTFCFSNLNYSRFIGKRTYTESYIFIVEKFLISNEILSNFICLM